MITQSCSGLHDPHFLRRQAVQIINKTVTLLIQDGCVTLWILVLGVVSPRGSEKASTQLYHSHVHTRQEI